MYGALAAAHDPRVGVFVFMAGTSSFSDWFLYGKPKLEGEAKETFVAELAPLDPIRHLPKLRAATAAAIWRPRFPCAERARAGPGGGGSGRSSRTYAAEHGLKRRGDPRADRVVARAIETRIRPSELVLAFPVAFCRNSRKRVAPVLGLTILGSVSQVESAQPTSNYRGRAE